MNGYSVGGNRPDRRLVPTNPGGCSNGSGMEPLSVFFDTVYFPHRSVMFLIYVLNFYQIRIMNNTIMFVNTRGQTQLKFYKVK